MAGVITRANFEPDYKPEQIVWFGEAYAGFDTQFTKVFTEHKMQHAMERSYKYSGLGAPNLLDEGEGVAFDTQVARWSVDFTVQKYGTGYIITEEAIADAIAHIVAKNRSRELGRAMAEKKEVLAANFLDGCWATQTTGDGSFVYSATHPQLQNTLSNVPAVAVSLSEAGLEQDVIDLGNQKGERGQRLNLKIRKLVVGRQNFLEVDRVLKSQGQVYTPDNTPNVLKDGGYVPEVVKLNYLNFASSYHILTDHAPEDGFLYLTKQEPTISMDNVFDSGNEKVKSIMRIGFGIRDPASVRGAYLG